MGGEGGYGRGGWLWEGRVVMGGEGGYGRGGWLWEGRVVMGGEGGYKLQRIGGVVKLSQRWMKGMEWYKAGWMVSYIVCICLCVCACVCAYTCICLQTWSCTYTYMYEERICFVF